jgi:hypothetical protein
MGEGCSVGINSGEGEVTNGAWTTVTLGDHTRGADLNTCNVFDSRERQDHGMTTLTHFISLAPQEVGISSGRRVRTAVHGSL